MNWVWVGHLEQGLTQTQLQPGAASSASTSDESEEQVCKDWTQLVTFRAIGVGLGSFAKLTLSQANFIANEHRTYTLDRA